MKAMILAAGRGERMRPLTEHTPKPLLQANNKALIEYTITALVKAGITDIIINLAYLGTQIQNYLGNGSGYQAHIQYSPEEGTGLETAGGIKQALPLLGHDPFLVINADIYCDYPLQSLINHPVDLAHLVLVNNPIHHTVGDFHINNYGLLNSTDLPKQTFSGIGVYRPELFSTLPAGKAALAPLLKQAMQTQRISGELYQGFWMDIGTPERLQELSVHLNNGR